ncbi:signal transduction histidine kinase [Methanolacinia petrolearia DSM 11571]|uniref:histidine kinase n=1 Tax=Methanolacinia petrolearia (strain DSM 11571 / OCM 486 / SEBR 4847) TaxID=679926 RepID=E1REL2_METP4|nr:PAS domain S-box protein [Methanolacinia petrolearia]ADN34959.1 signal transduction histidine kinase [Methanolacinia petrolearia DSM 11571]
MDFAILLRQKQLFWLSIIALISFFMSEVVIFMLSGESFIVISQVIFFLIVLISLLVPEKSLIINVFIGFIYLIFSALSAGPDFYELVPSMVQFYVFISMSIIISRIILEVRYNEKKYYGLLENTTRGICIYDSEERSLVEKNHAFVYDPSIFFERARSVNPDFFGARIENAGKSSTFEIEYESADGEKLELLVFAERLFERYILFIVTDITESKRNVENSQIVSSLSNALLRGSNIGASSSFTSYAARNISDTCWVGIYLLNDEKNAYRLVSSHNLPEPFEKSFSTIDLGDRIGELIAGGDTVEIDSAALGIVPAEEEPHLQRSVLIVPVYMTNKPIGCIFAVTDKGKKFSESSKNSLNSIAHIFGSALKRINAEKEIIIAKSNLESLFESLDDFIFIYDNEGGIIHTNSTVSGKLGYTTRQLEEMNVAAIHSSPSFEVFDREIRSRISDKSITMPFNLVKSNGEKIPVEMKAVVGKWGDSEVFFVIDRDVTLRKKHEDEIRSRDAILDAVSIIAENFLRADAGADNISESLERLGKAADVASVCLFEVKWTLKDSYSPENVYKWVNDDNAFVPNVESLIRLSVFQEWRGMTTCPPEMDKVVYLDIESVSGEDRKIFETLNIKTLIAVILTVDGSFRGVMCLVESVKRIWSDIETEAIMIAGDIISSAIGRAETDEIFRIPIERSLVGVYHIQNFTFKYVNPKLAEIFGYTREEMLGDLNLVELVHPDYRQLLIDTVQSFKSSAIDGNGGTGGNIPDFHIDARGIKKDGTLNDVEIYGSMMLHSGKFSFIGMVMDITQRKEAERKLYESSEMLDLALKSTKLGIYDWNLRDDKLFYSDALFTMLGYSPEDYEEGRMSFDAIIHPDDKDEKKRKLRAHLEGKTPYYETEYRLRTKDGEWRWIAARGEVFERDSSGKAVRITGTHLDITERKNAEEKISHLNRVLKAVRNVNELIVRETDINNLINGASKLLVETRGYLDAWVILTDRYGSYLDSAGSGDREDVAEIIRKTKSGNPPKILVETLRTTEIVSLSRLMYPEGDPADEGELLCRRLDYGENVFGVVFGVIIISIPSGLSEDQEELGLFNELASDISFAIHDILLQNERKSYEEQILSSLEEKTVLLQEVHHRVKNNLQIISGLIKMQSRNVEDPSARDSLLRCENRIMAIAMVHEALYRSESLSDIHAREHFINLAQSLIDSLSFTEYKDIKLKTDIEIISLPINIAIPCSLIINEIISNAIKYAFTGRDSGEISLVFRSEDENYYLEVSDNGVGVPDDFDLDRSKSLGMRLVRRLAVEQLRGTAEIITGEGTRFIFIFPKHPEQGK